MSRPFKPLTPKPRATLRLRASRSAFEKTRDGERVIGLLTNLPATSRRGYRGDLPQAVDHRDAIQLLTVSVHCEVPGLGKPKAALFAFAMS
jgi:hypothetical protein